MLAEGLTVETYPGCGNRSAFANGGRLRMLFADFAGDSWEMSGYAPLVLRGPEVGATCVHLFTRAAALARATEAFAGSMTIERAIADKRGSYFGARFTSLAITLRGRPAASAGYGGLQRPDRSNQPTETEINRKSS